VIARFWAKVDRSNPDGCWLWTAYCDKRGYGAFGLAAGKTVFAHRFMWEITYGPVPPGLNVCHHCDNPPCCRPDHLFTGTQRENLADMSRKGRRESPWLRRPGESNVNVSLTEAEVRAIRAAYAAGGISQQALAERYGVSQVSVSRVIRHETWTHLDP